MRLLEYTDLDTRRVKTSYAKVCKALIAGDFRAAQVKKIGAEHGLKLYRAKLDDSNRLLFALIRIPGAAQSSTLPSATPPNPAAVSTSHPVALVALEIIENHAYDKSRFLRGHAVDEAKLVAVDTPPPASEAQSVRYLHPSRPVLHLLDKPLSLDDAQFEVYQKTPPLILVGSAGSGKTALTLEKLKTLSGDVLYVTLSAFLARNARDLYHAHGYERDGQQAEFLSYRELLESLQVPPGREALWRDFAGWFERQRQQFKDLQAHQVFEEIRGVIGAQADRALSRADYLALGVRQSIFTDEQRDAVYTLFERYQAWLASNQLYDLNLIAQQWQAKATPRYDFAVIDEVQDLTPAQLALVLKLIRKPGQFLLCGDSNQIVHPNFFSWSAVKSLFWRDEKLAAKQTLQVLSANFRNGLATTRLANRLLKIKHQRFGSIDRETNFLVQAVGGDEGSVALIADRDAALKELAGKLRGSTQVAVLVMHDDDKPAARKLFGTPLTFSVHEAKGLEYDSIVLYRLVSEHRAAFATICDGVQAQALKSDDLQYARGRDKTDKSLEIFKFYVNALYVAMTRAVRHLVIVEGDVGHPLFGLLGLQQQGQVKVEAKASSKEDWQAEARKLELQGKTEQAEAIRRDILRETPPPWPVWNEAWLRNTVKVALIDKPPGNKLPLQLNEYASAHYEPALAASLWDHRQLAQARHADITDRHFAATKRMMVSYLNANFKEVLRQCDAHGIEHRTALNLTPLMAAAWAGNLPLIDALLKRGANPDARDHYGWSPLHWAMRAAMFDQDYAKQRFTAVYDRVAPSVLDLVTDGRLVRLQRHQAEYMAMQSLWMHFKLTLTSRLTVVRGGGFAAGDLTNVWELWPHQVVSEARRKLSAVNHVLSRNEINRDYAYNRKLFERMSLGIYQFNPQMLVRIDPAVLAAGRASVPKAVAPTVQAQNANRADAGSPTSAASLDPSAQATAARSEHRPQVDPDTLRQAGFVSIFEALNLRLIAGMADEWNSDHAKLLLIQSGLAQPDEVFSILPESAETAYWNRRMAQRQAELAQQDELKRAEAQHRAQAAALQPAALRPASSAKPKRPTTRERIQQMALDATANKPSDATPADDDLSYLINGFVPFPPRELDAIRVEYDELGMPPRPPWGSSYAKQWEVERIKRMNIVEARKKQGS